MKKENILYSIIGLLLGFIVGFTFANTTNRQGYAAPGVTSGQQPANLPPNHPAIENSGPSAEAIEAAAKLAAEQPDNFDAQARAAEQLYAAHRYPEAIKLFERANQLRPEEFDVILGLGNANFDAERFEDAGRWYGAALKRQPDNVNVRTDLGLTFFFREPRDIERAVKEFRASLERDPAHVPTLQNLTIALNAAGDREGARATLAKLEKVSPQNAALPRLRAELEKTDAAVQTPAKTSTEKGGD
ncbi:MAG: tetratricopeptide repeat protein [Pyrinomonadaceae bacterium]